MTPVDPIRFAGRIAPVLDAPGRLDLDYLARAAGEFEVTDLLERFRLQ